MKTEYHHNHIPHFHHIGATFFVTWLLFDAVPKPLLNRLKEERKAAIQKILLEDTPDKAILLYWVERDHFYKLEELLHGMENQSHLLKNPEAAQILQAKLKQYDDQYYRLVTHTILSNHAHAVLDFSIQLPANGTAPKEEEYTNLDKVMNLVKGGSAYEINRLLNRSAAFGWKATRSDIFGMQGTLILPFIMFLTMRQKQD